MDFHEFEGSLIYVLRQGEKVTEGKKEQEGGKRGEKKRKKEEAWYTQGEQRGEERNKAAHAPVCKPLCGASGWGWGDDAN